MGGWQIKAHGRKFDRIVWRGKLFSIRRPQCVTWTRWGSAVEAHKLFALAEEMLATTHPTRGTDHERD